jgi:hypothetical protein
LMLYFFFFLIIIYLHNSQYYGYDKLSPSGIGISECIDRFSRYMLWIEAYQTNRDPKLIAERKFVQSVVLINMKVNNK